MMRIQTKNYVFYTTYCKDYYSVLANTEYPYYEQIIEVYGEPDKITREKYTEEGDYLIYHEYDDGRLFVFSDNENGNRNPFLGRIELTNPEYRFGRKKLELAQIKVLLKKYTAEAIGGCSRMLTESILWKTEIL